MDATCESTSQIDAPSKDAIPYNLNAMEFDFILSDAEFEIHFPIRKLVYLLIRKTIWIIVQK
jgi:hypothetical protein